MNTHLLPLALAALTACTRDVAGPPAHRGTIPPSYMDSAYRDIAVPYGLYDAAGHLYSVFGGVDSAGPFTLHLRDALRFALLREHAGGFSIDLSTAGGLVASFALSRPALSALIDCKSADESYLNSAVGLINATRALATGGSHVVRRRAALAARLFHASWAVRRDCPMTD